MYIVKLIISIIFIIQIFNGTLFCQPLTKIQIEFTKFGDEINCEVAKFLLQGYNPVLLRIPDCSTCDYDRDIKGKLQYTPNNEIAKDIEEKKKDLRDTVVNKNSFLAQSDLLIQFCYEKVEPLRGVDSAKILKNKLTTIRDTYYKYKPPDTTIKVDSTIIPPHTHTEEEISFHWWTEYKTYILLLVLSFFLVLFYFKSYKPFKDKTKIIVNSHIDFIKDYNEKNIPNLLKNIESNISNFPKDIGKTIEIENEINHLYDIIEKLREKIVSLETNSFNKPGLTQIRKKDEEKYFITYYLPYPNEDGTFDDARSLESDFTKPFRLILSDEKSDKGEFDIVTNENIQKNLITQFHIYLTPVADILTHNKQGNRIKVNNNGKLELKNGKWFVKDKIQIDIV